MMGLLLRSSREFHGVHVCTICLKECAGTHLGKKNNYNDISGHQLMLRLQRDMLCYADTD